MKKKKIYAIYTAQGKYVHEKKVNTQDEIQQYLNKVSKDKKLYMAIHLSGSTKKIAAGKLKKLELAVRKEKPFLSKKDLQDLTMLIKVLKERPARYGMVIGAVLDSAIRDIIPIEVWEAMGGEIKK
ncbi:hypothetical protein [Aquimarina algicola]|uniref:Uncharacterized protein n=1 Tax=Aquimarina algicola TaxID=2589995 RepID=A0A504J8C5_9FLAO|nr:hypothetical protein [Aquimarina algicola]TPN82930.1 hypothetical protein FHK87_21120 [Aquimarina algicola]